MPTQQEVADHLDMTTRNVRALRDAGTIPDPRAASLDAIRTAYIRHLREIAAGRGSHDGKLDLVAERARLTALQAQRAELELGEQRGELLRADEVETMLARLASTVVENLRSLPRKVAPSVATAGTIPAAESIIREHLDAALHAIADEGDRFEAVVARR